MVTSRKLTRRCWSGRWWLLGIRAEDFIVFGRSTEDYFPVIGPSVYEGVLNSEELGLWAVRRRKNYLLGVDDGAG